ncbi:hypothetical protein C1N81_05710 (plasmid) [Streptomyces sp. SGAir0957]
MLVNGPASPARRRLEEFFEFLSILMKRRILCDCLVESVLQFFERSQKPAMLKRTENTAITVRERIDYMSVGFEMIQMLPEFPA